MISIQDLLLRKFAWQSSGWLETTLNQMLLVRAQLLDQQLSTCWQFQQFVWWPFQLVKEEGNLLCIFLDYLHILFYCLQFGGKLNGNKID